MLAHRKLRTAAVAAVPLVALGLAACGSSSTTASPSTTAAPASPNPSSSSTTAGSTGGGSGTLTGSDTVAFLMPDEASTRYVTYDIPSFKSEMKTLCPGCKVIAEDANGDANLQKQQFEAALSQGAKAVVIDAVDSASAASVVNQAQAQGVKVVSYDRPIPTIKTNYYVSFDNQVVGATIAKAEIDHLKATGATAKGGILLVNGSPTDAAAGLIKKGVHSVVDTSGVKVLAEYDTPDWTPALAQSWVASQVTRFGSKIVGVVAANDGTGTAAVAAFQAANVKPVPPTTGNDATLAGVQLLLNGDMYVTISKPGKTEADAAAHAVTDLLQGKTPSLQAGGHVKTVFGTPSQLFPPVLITAQNVESQLVNTGFLKASAICTSTYAAACTRYGVH